MPRFQWAIYQASVRTTSGQSILAIDVEPPLVPEQSIVRLIFNGRTALPQGVTLTSDLYVDFERWKAQWPTSIGWRVASQLNGIFQRALMLGIYGPGWQQQARRERINRTTREVLFILWSVAPRERFGGYSFAEFLRWKDGAYEITGKGFVWKGQLYPRGYGVEFHPFFNWEQANKDVRWYLERHVSLSEAIGLTFRQWDRLHKTMLAGFAITLTYNAPALGISPGRELANRGKSIDDVIRIAEATGQVASIDWVPLPSYTEAFLGAVKHYESHRDEIRIQQISKRSPVPIAMISSRVR